MFDLQSTLRAVKAATSHLSGLKIARGHGGVDRRFLLGGVGVKLAADSFHAVEHVGVFDLFDEMVFAGNPLAHNILGTQEEEASTV